MLRFRKLKEISKKTFAMWKSKTQVTSYELSVQIYELRVQIHELED